MISMFSILQSFSRFSSFSFRFRQPLLGFLRYKSADMPSFLSRLSLAGIISPLPPRRDGWHITADEIFSPASFH
jgi:hypothetical protein